MDLNNLSFSEIQQALFVFDGMTRLPELQRLLKLLKSNNYIHIIVLSTSNEPPNNLIKEVDHKILRGCKVHSVEPLTMIHSTQRIVHSLMKKVEVTPSNADQELFEKLAEFTSGSPVIVDIASEVVSTCYEHLTQHESEAVVHLNEMLSLDHQDSPKQDTLGRNYYLTDTKYDSWESIVKLVEECDLSVEEKLLLNCVSIFGRAPVPLSLLTEMSSMITQTSRNLHLAGSLLQKLLKYKLLKVYPQPLIFHPALSLSKDSTPPDGQVPKFVYVPEQVSQSLWNGMEDIDKIVVLSIAFSTLSSLKHHSEDCDIGGVCSILVQLFEQNYALVGEDCYQKLYSFYLCCI